MEGVGNNVGGMDVEKWEDGEMGGGSKVGRGTCGSWDGAVASHLPPDCSPAGIRAEISDPLKILSI